MEVMAASIVHSFKVKRKGTLPDFLTNSQVKKCFNNLTNVFLYGREHIFGLRGLIGTKYYIVCAVFVYSILLIKILL